MKNIIGFKRKNTTIDEQLIQIVSKLPLYASANFFVQGEEGKIVLLEPEELEKIYKENYSSMDYKQFIRKALNQQLIIETKNKGESFELDKTVTDNYKNNGFSDFLKLYSEKSQKDKRLWLKTDLEEHQLYSIFYYFFINNYLTRFDDSFGNYYISKTSELTGNSEGDRYIRYSI